MQAYAAERWEDFKDEAIEDGEAFLSEAKDDLQRWTKALGNGDLSKDDFEWLVESKKDLFELHALKQKGLTKIKISKFINGVVDLIVNTAFKTFL
jgi:hypothetical protein